MGPSWLTNEMKKLKGKAVIDTIKLGMICLPFYVYLMKSDAHLFRDEGLICDCNRNVKKCTIFGISSNFFRKFTANFRTKWTLISIMYIKFWISWHITYLKLCWTFCLNLVFTLFLKDAQMTLKCHVTFKFRHSQSKLTHILTKHQE